MLMPKRTKYRKMHRGRNKGIATRGNSLDHGDFGLQATTMGNINSRQIEAARRVGMGRESAYRLRKRPGAAGFANAWDVALGSVRSEAGRARLDAALEAARAAKWADRKVTIPELEWRVATGLWQVMLRGGRYVGVVRKPDETALLALLSRTRAAAERA